MKDRDVAFTKSRETNNIEDIRHYKNLRNQVNKMVSINNYKTKSSMFTDPEVVTTKQRWNLIKNLTGQSKNSPPEMILKDNEMITSPLKIANIMNKDYIKVVRDTIDAIPITNLDPIKNYKEAIGEIENKLQFKEINMHDLRKILNAMKPTGSSSYDYISMKTIKKARKSLEPLILKLVNTTISTSTYADLLKIIKILPHSKPDKDILLTESWRPINLVPALSKIIEKTMSLQIMEHLVRNNLIHNNHHGGLKGKSTQTAVIEIHDLLTEILETGGEAIFIAIDQSKSFDLVDHDILLEKLKIIGFNQKSIKLMASYLADRKQYVQVNGFDSDRIDVGPYSVAQGSILSCLLHLIYILDFPKFFHKEKHSPIEYRNCSEPNAKTFVDDFMLAIKVTDKDFKQKAIDNINLAQTYLSSNKQAMNNTKTKIMIITKDKTARDSFSIKINNEIIKHSPTLKILGNTFNDKLNFENMLIHGNDSILNQLKNRIRSIEMMSRFMNTKTLKQYVNAIFRGKLLFGLNTWGGSLKTHLEQIQRLQNRAAKLALGNKFLTKSDAQRHKELNWLTINQEISYATNITTFSMIKGESLHELAPLMPLNENNLRIAQHKKLAAKPRILNSTLRYQLTYRSRAYQYNCLPGEITRLDSKNKFKEKLRKFMLTGKTGNR